MNYKWSITYQPVQVTYLDNTTTEKHFNYFLDYWEQTSMMYTNPSVKKTLNSHNLLICKMKIQGLILANFMLGTET